MRALDYSDKRCLVIEDRRPFLMLLRGLLNSLGARKITTEMSAEAGIKACKTTKFDIIVCDLHLGTNRKNGFEFLEEIRKRHLVRPSTVFIMISGDSTRSMVLGSIEKQPDDYLVKPFSQAQLNSRITRATKRRITLSALYSQINHEKYELSIETCQHFLETEPHYANHLLQILVELYWKTERYDEAEAVLKKILKQRQLQWALCAMAKTKLFQQEFAEAIDLAKQAIDSSVHNVEAFDIIADAYLQDDKKPEALKFILEALSLSPLSIDRHFRVCEIARENGDFELAMNSAKSIFELSQRSVHKNVNHLCGYVRSIIDRAESADDKNTRNKYMQESLLALQRARTDESIKTQPDDFDFKIFEKIVHARMLHLEGKASEAKKALEETQITIEREFSEYPVAMAADSLKVMLDLGDFEEAAKLINVIKSSPDKVDSSILYLASAESDKIKDSRAKYVKHTKHGIALYSEGNYTGAYIEFEEAKKISPLNIGVTLNLLQSLVKMIQNTEKPEGKHVMEARDLYRFVSNMPLKKVHKKKFESMKKDVEDIVA
jgi:DNA-binding response OmpR family regulator